jgi:hypothetical protein
MTRQITPQDEEQGAITEYVPSSPSNPFESTTDERLNAGTVAIESQRATAEVQASLLIARHYPRDKSAAWKRIMATCSRIEFAEKAEYAYPRGNQTVKGPTIRLAEELARSWGNVEFGIRELAQYEDETEVEAYCWDLETNVRSKQTFRVPNERFAGGSRKKLNDPRDIYENNANMGARRLRSRILAVIPPDVVADALKQCYSTIAVSQSKKPLEERVAAMVRGFEKIGVAKDKLEVKLRHPVEKINTEEYCELIAIFNSLNDNMTQPSDWFAMPKTTGASEKAKEVEAILNVKSDAPTCDDCGKPVPAELVDTSIAKFDKAYCAECQEKHEGDNGQGTL